MITTSKVISLGLLSIGIFVLTQVALPIISFKFWEIGQKYNGEVLISPKTGQSQVLGISIEEKNNFPSFVSTSIRENLPYTKFNLIIPRINLDKEVYVESNDLSKGLVHLPGTALPGEKGNIFISGHSALSSILSKVAYFAKLPDVKKGDRIEVLAAGSKFKYQIVEIRVVDPTDISVILPPDKSGRYISLMTCVPPGLNFKRLIVLGKMI